MAKKLITWTGIAVLIFFVAFRPGDAADFVGLLGDTAARIMGGVGSFLDGLVS